jgi:hypothetical protein
MVNIMPSDLQTAVGIIIPFLILYFYSHLSTGRKHRMTARVKWVAGFFVVCLFVLLTFNHGIVSLLAVTCFLLFKHAPVLVSHTKRSKHDQA